MSTSTSGTATPTRLDRVLGTVERVGDKVPHPFVLFAYLLVLVAVASTALDLAGVSVTVPGSDDATPVQGLLTPDGMTWLLTSFVENFTSFPPLGNVVVMLLAVGVAEQSGLLKAAITASFSRAPAWALPYVVALVAAQGHVMSDPSMIVIPPLAALVFLAAGRHPLAGMLGAFACTTAGYSSGILIGSLDALLAGITTSAAKIVDGLETTPVTIASNWWISIATGILLPLAGGFLIDRVIEPRLPAYDVPDGDEHTRLDARERRGLLAAALVGLVLLVGAFTAWLVPGSPLRGEGGDLVPSPFLDAIVPMLAILFLATGTTYGVVTRAVAKAADVPEMMTEAMRGLAGYVVFIFIAAQVIAIFTWSGLGTVIAVELAEGLDAVGITGFGAVMGLVLIAAVINLFITSGSAMWALMAPVMVPTFALVGLEPGFVQAAYRIGDSVTQVITPLNPYLIVLLGFARRYEPGLQFGALMARMAVFVPVFFVVWVAALAVFYFTGTDVGPGMPIRLPQN
ncbi:aminobenzoyl-glutamate transport protein [Nocardioides scoriae]|uniref:Aminobenzoyl-glutamate transport protein n=1 Tax=Nocardioides scoriae TaxID=642780 RepID=A0A1H1RIZ9_9ACTN|nr:AbgT family transporter [Nocardioides scoriae]SDS35623.1 aminobenzoyl-glutamate transport protein [Nocardioides scoriae]